MNMNTYFMAQLQQQQELKELQVDFQMQYQMVFKLWAVSHARVHTKKLSTIHTITFAVW